MKVVLMKFPYDEAILHKAYEMSEMLAYDIVGVISCDLNETSKFYNGYPVFPLMEIFNLSFDAAIAACDDETFNTNVPKFVKLGMGTKEQFKDLFWLLQQFMIKKYEHIADPVIQRTLKYWETHELSVFNQHFEKWKQTRHVLYIDEECDLPYVVFDTIEGKKKRMYYPRGQATESNRNALVNLMQEQAPTSPHLYIKGKHKINAGDIVIDAGVCEGNFALRYIDLCSKMYLFEPDENWFEPLQKTFKDYGDKVEFIPKFLSDKTDDKNITIDDALPDFKGKNIFLKMDIEGAEPSALRGAKRILTNNKVKASVCTYHNAYDLIKVKSIFQSYGYKTSTSDGYMVFMYDLNIFNTMDFRKGICYAEN